MMSDQANWNSNQIEDCSGTRSSQDTICSQDHSGFANHGQIDETGIFNGGGQEDKQMQLPLSNNLTLNKQSTSLFPDAVYNQSLTLTSDPSGSRSMFKLDPAVLINEDTQMCVSTGGVVDGNGPMESPFDFTSPGCEPGDISSPFEAMESDGINDADEPACISGNNTRRSFWSSGHFSTTTPRDSSDEDHYESSGSRKKRRRTKREMHPSDSFAQSHFQYYSHSSQIASPVCITDITNGSEQSGVAGLNFQKSRNSQQLVNNSDSNLYATIVKNKRRNSNASESNQSSISCTKDTNFPITENSMASMSSFMAENELTNSISGFGETQLKRMTGNDLSDSMLNIAASKLQGHFPSSASGYSLEIVVQPEDQHRARYLTEGSRGPVKDRTQQGFPQIQLKGYSGKTTLHVYVGADADDKVRPHGFYQACKVTGRNTTSCEEIEIEGTKVIQIPFDAQEPISVDCVGILKLRNADVELRIGANRAKKRSQTVRLVFRVLLDHSGNDHNPLVLQVVSDRINCTQPRGQPEIVRKSLERCSVDGNEEMFIIGKNFHRGTKVIFQDSKEPDGSHWQQAGQIDKDTFNQSHLVVRIPPYHDKDIAKSVNVQLYVEHDGRKCDPHSFTYDPSPAKLAQLKEAENQEKEAKKEQDDPLKTILSSQKIDRKHLEKMVALLLSTGLSDVNESKAQTQASTSVVQENPTNSNHVMSVAVVSSAPRADSNQPLFFTADSKQLSSTVQKPVPIPVQTASEIPAANRVLIRPQTFIPVSQTAAVAPVASSAVLMSTKPSVNSNSTSGVTSQVTTGLFTSDQPLFQASTSTVFNTVSTGTAMPVIINVKSEQTKPWPEHGQLQGQPSMAMPVLGDHRGIALPSQNVSLVSSSGQSVVFVQNPIVQQQQTQSNNMVNQTTVDNSILQGQQQLSTPMNQMLSSTSTLQQQMTNQIVTAVEHSRPVQQQQISSISGIVTVVNSAPPMQQISSIPGIVSAIDNSPVLPQQRQMVAQLPGMVTQVETNVQSQQQNSMSALINPGEANQNLQSMPLERSTPVKEAAAENATSFAAATQNQWQSQVINAGPGLTFSQGQASITSTQNAALFVNNSLSQTIAMNNSLTATTGVQSNARSGENMQQQVNQWVSAANATNDVKMTSQSANSTGQCAMQWQSAPQQESAPSAPLSHSNSNEFVFGIHSSEQNMAASQQQVFTIANAMEILNSQQTQDANIIPSLPDALSNPPVESHASDMITPNVLPGADIFVDDQTMLQSILSDLSNHAEQTPMAQDTRTPVPQPAEFSAGNSSQATLSQQNEARIPQHQETPTDVEMVPAQLKTHPPEEGHPVFINQNVDPQMFLIMPTEVQPVSQQQQVQVPQHSHNASMSDVDQSRITPNFGLPEQMQQNLPLSTTSTAANVESISSNGQFQTIDSSVLDLNTGNTSAINQAFSGFEQPPTSNVGS